MDPYETNGLDNTSAKLRRQEEILARVAVVEGDDISDIIDDVFLGCDEEEDVDGWQCEVDNVLLYKGNQEIGMECDVTENLPSSRK